MKVWVYHGRHGELHVFPGTLEGFEAARAMQDSDNRCPAEELEMEGSYETGHVFIDEGGTIDLVEVEEP